MLRLSWRLGARLHERPGARSPLILGRRTTVKPRMPNGRRTPRRSSPRSRRHARWPIARVACCRDVRGHTCFERVALQMSVAAPVALLDQPERRDTGCCRGARPRPPRARPAAPWLRARRGVATLVAQKAVVVVIGPGPLGTTSTPLRARRQHAAQLRQRRSSSGTCSSRLALIAASTLSSLERQRAHVRLQQARVGHAAVRLAQPRRDQVDADRAAHPGSARADPPADSRSSSRDRRSRAPAASGPSRSSIARRVHTSMKCSRLLLGVQLLELQPTS